MCSVFIHMCPSLTCVTYSYLPSSHSHVLSLSFILVQVSFMCPALICSKSLIHMSHVPHSYVSYHLIRAHNQRTHIYTGCTTRDVTYLYVSSPPFICVDFSFICVPPLYIKLIDVKCVCKGCVLFVCIMCVYMCVYIHILIFTRECETWHI